MTKKSNRGRRYTPAEKKRILEEAKKDNLSGAEVQKRFGVSALTFYRWRGPVRRRRVVAKRRASTLDIDALVRARLQQVLPRIVREQMNAYLAEILGGRNRR